MWLVVAFGRMLDHLLLPGFRRQEVREPVFIIAPPRSGTTLTQKLMALDDERFVHAKLYQTIFPAVCYQRCFDAIAWLDRHTGQPLTKLVGWAEKRFFGGWDDMHKLRFRSTRGGRWVLRLQFCDGSDLLVVPARGRVVGSRFSGCARPGKPPQAHGLLSELPPAPALRQWPRQDRAFESDTIVRGGGVAARSLSGREIHHHHPAPLPIRGVARKRVLPGVVGAFAGHRQGRAGLEVYARLAVRWLSTPVRVSFESGPPPILLVSTTAI